MIDLTIIIPAKNEEFLSRTIQDLCENLEDNTEIIAVLDGYLPNPTIKSDPRITVIYNPESVGQRAASNQAAKLAKGKYLMKVDAHCCFDKGFDRKMLEAFKVTGDNVTMIPVMKNLHAFDWVCANGHRRYQGKPGNCPECGLPQTKDVVWQAKPSPARFTFCFDKTLHFQYDGEQAKKPESVAQGDYRETLSIQGSCFMLTKEKWFELDICSEDFNSWGQQGVEVACKTWLSGGRVIAYLGTWYAHMFRTNNFGGFPYENPESLINANRELSRELFQKNKWPQATRTFEWLMEKFNPPGWDVSKGIIYFTDSQLDEKIAKPVRDTLYQISQEDHLPITSASLKKMDFGVKNIHFPSLKRGYKTMFKQIIAALENSHEDIIFFCEHDVLYHPSHFDFMPKDKDTFYYNENVWFLRLPDGHGLHYDVKQVSGICVYRQTALTHYKERYALVEQKEKELTEDEFNSWIRHMGFEPMTHGRISWKNHYGAEGWKSKYPNIDIKHGANLTGQRWRKDQYRNQNLLINWQETDDEIQDWGKTSDIVKRFL
jgi:hypothetical protein